MKRKQKDPFDKSEEDIIFDDILETCKEAFPDAVVVEIKPKNKKNA